MKVLGKKKLHFQKKYIYLLALFISLIVILQISNRKGAVIQFFLEDIVYYFSNYFIWAFLVEYINHIQWPSKKITFKKVYIIILNFILIASIHLLLNNLVYYGFLISFKNATFNSAFLEFKPIVFQSLLSRFLDLSIIIILLRIFETYSKLQEKKLQVLSLERDLHQTQLLALQAQLNPHFLFNSLHTLNTLIGFDDKKARSMVMKITDLLRKILNHKETPYITFYEELEYFNTYLDIEQERFNDRLSIATEVDENTHPIKVPTLFLQPLIENAFKHGIALVDGNAEIILKAKLENKNLIVTLKNSIPKEERDIENSTKIGLQNLQKRLDTMFDDNYEFYSEKKEDMFVVTVKIKNLS